MKKNKGKGLAVGNKVIQTRDDPYSDLSTYSVCVEARPFGLIRKEEDYV